MTIYLWEKFKGKYRVLPELDLETKTIPKDYAGNIDASFNDYYIPCRGGGRITHATGNELMYYAPSNVRVNNMILKIYEYLYKKMYNYTEIQKVTEILLQKGFLVVVEQLDGEGYFIFKSKYLTEWVDILKPNTQGAFIHPHSCKNIPVEEFNIPQEDLQKYIDIVQSENKTADKKMEHVRVIRDANKQFAIEHKLDLKQLKSELHIRDTKSIFYKVGLWNEYIEFLSNYFY